MYEIYFFSDATSVFSEVNGEHPFFVWVEVKNLCLWAGDLGRAPRSSLIEILRYKVFLTLGVLI